MQPHTIRHFYNSLLQFSHMLITTRVQISLEKDRCLDRTSDDHFQWSVQVQIGLNKIELLNFILIRGFH